MGYSEVNPDDYGWCKPNVIFFGELAPAYGKMYDILDTLTRGYGNRGWLFKHGD